MKYFSYNDFMDCAENGKIEEITRVNENIVKYTLTDENYKTQKKIIEILKKESEMKLFLKEFFNMVEIENINYYNTKKLMANEDILPCKIKSKEIYIVIKVIENIDINISYKMFQYSINIIKQWENQENINKIRPIVIPIVIYLGNKVWKNSNNKGYDKINYITYKNNRVNFSYNIINISELEKIELEKMESKVAKEIIKLKNKYLQIN